MSSSTLPSRRTRTRPPFRRYVELNSPDDGDRRAHKEVRKLWRAYGHSLERALAAAENLIRDWGFIDKYRWLPAVREVEALRIELIWKVGKAKGLDRAEVERLSLQAFARKPEALTEAEAAALIKELSNLRRKTA